MLGSIYAFWFAMREFLQANVPWIFSGVGIPILAALWWLFRKRFSHSAITPSLNPASRSELRPAAAPVVSISAPEAAPPPDTLSPQHMMKTVASAAPLARDHVKQQFIDLPVEWRLPFSDARKLPLRPVATVYFLLPDSNYEVRCEASLEEFPFLRVATPGEIFGIRGVISDVSSFEVVLRDVMLSR